MQQLDSKALRELTDLLLPYCQTSEDRLTLFTLAFGIGHPLLNQLNYVEHPYTFVLNAITRLNGFGRVESGKPALAVLLEEVRERPDANKRQIDRLLDTLDLDRSVERLRSQTSSTQVSETDTSRQTGALLRELREADARGQWGEVINIGEMLLKTNPYHSIAVPKTANAYYERAKTHEYGWEADVAIADLSRALSLNPLLQDAYYERGKAYAARGDYDSAIADLSRAIQLDPANSEYYRARESVYQRKGSPNEARSDAKRADDLNAKLSKNRF